MRVLARRCFVRLVVQAVDRPPSSVLCLPCLVTQAVLAVRCPVLGHSRQQHQLVCILCVSLSAAAAAAAAAAANAAGSVATAYLLC
jgi:hypothetical protein